MHLSTYFCCSVSSACKYIYIQHFGREKIINISLPTSCPSGFNFPSIWKKLWKAIYKTIKTDKYFLCFTWAYWSLEVWCFFFLPLSAWSNSEVIFINACFNWCWCNDENTLTFVLDQTEEKMDYLIMLQHGTSTRYKL